MLIRNNKLLILDSGLAKQRVLSIGGHSFDRDKPKPDKKYKPLLLGT